MTNFVDLTKTQKIKHIGDKAPQKETLRFYTIESISEHRAKTPEGYLLCLEAALSRTGTMIYRADEVPVTPSTDGLVTVVRYEEDVFNPDSIASFNGKSVVNEHPVNADGEPVDVNPDNWRNYEVGTMLHPRRGEGDKKDCVVADLLIKDPTTIDLIESGKVQLSVGYDAEYEEIKPGFAKQFGIIANHVAVVQHGRCGIRCAIMDEDTIKKLNPSGDGKMNVKEAFSNLEKSFTKVIDESIKEGLKDKAMAEIKTETSTDALLAKLVDKLDNLATDIKKHFTSDRRSRHEDDDDDRRSRDRRRARHHEDDDDDDDDDDKKHRDRRSRHHEDDDDEDDRRSRDRRSRHHEDDDARDNNRDRRSRHHEDDEDDRRSRDRRAKEDDSKYNYSYHYHGAHAGDDDDDDRRSRDRRERDRRRRDDDDAHFTDKRKRDAEAKERELEEEAGEKNKDKARKAKDSVFLEDSYQEVISFAEILVPGVRVPAFTRDQAPLITLDDMCKVRTAVLESFISKPEGRTLLLELNKGVAPDFRGMSCAAVRSMFRDAALIMKRVNNKAASTVDKDISFGLQKINNNIVSDPTAHNEWAKKYWEGQYSYGTEVKQ